MKNKKPKEKKEYTPEEKQIRKKCRIDLLVCLIYAVLIELFFVSLNANYMSVSVEKFNLYAKISYIVFVFIAILMFEIAYRKEKKNLIITGIEFIVLAIHTLLIERSITLFKENNILSTSYIWPIYYCLKAVLIQTKENRRRLKQISDISEIIKEEKPTKKVAKKRKT